MAQEWFYTKDGKGRVGPFSSSELQAFAKSGQLLPADMVWKQGMSQWTAANAVKGLFTKVESTPKSAAVPVAGHAPANPVQMGEASAASDDSLLAATNTRLSSRAKVALIVGGALLLILCIVVPLLMIGPSKEKTPAEIDRRIEAIEKELDDLKALRAKNSGEKGPGSGAGDSKKIQGTWEVIDVVADGQSVNDREFREARLVFSGDKMNFLRKDCTFKLDTTKKPKAIDLTEADGNHKGELMLGIYRLDGDRLLLCLPEGVAGGRKDRPTEFAAPRNSNLFLLTLRRI